MVLASNDGTAVFSMASLICAGVSSGLHSNISAATPAATGDACDVPRYVDVVPLSPSESIGAPGAAMSIRAGVLLKHVILSKAVMLSAQSATAEPKRAW